MISITVFYMVGSQSCKLMEQYRVESYLTPSFILLKSLLISRCDIDTLVANMGRTDCSFEQLTKWFLLFRWLCQIIFNSVKKMTVSFMVNEYKFRRSY